jgi:hypothetical protein
MRLNLEIINFIRYTILNFSALSFGLQKQCFFFSRKEVGFVSLLEEGLWEVITHFLQKTIIIFFGCNFVGVEF